MPTPWINNQKIKAILVDVIEPKVSKEDAMIAVSQGDLVAARTHEHLLEPDKSMYEVRLRIKEAFLTQRKGKRVAPTEDSLAWPVGPG